MKNEAKMMEWSMIKELQKIEKLNLEILLEFNI